MACRFDLRHQGCVISIKTTQDSQEEKKCNTSEIKEKSKICLTLAIVTLSEANGLLSKTRFYKNGKAKPEHWTESHARHKVQKNAIYCALNPHKCDIGLPCTVKMVRLAPHELDADDNLRIAFKWIKDAIAELITGDYVPGRADSDKRITWQYDQEKSKEYGVKIEITW